MKKRMFSLFLSLLLIIGTVPMSAMTASAETTTNTIGSFTITGDNLADSYSASGTVITVKDGANITLSGTASNYRFIIDKDATATITLNTFSCTCPDWTATIMQQAGSKLKVVLASGTTNTLASGKEGSAIRVPGSAWLVIEGEGTLNASVNATAGALCSVIGGKYNEAYGNIVINSGTLNISGKGKYLTAIGAGYYGGETTIGNGVIFLNGGTINTTLPIGGSLSVHSIISGIGGTTTTATLNSNVKYNQLVANGNDVLVGGNVTLDSNYTMESGKSFIVPSRSTLTINSGKTFTVPDGETLTVFEGGKINNYGTIDNYGSIAGRNNINLLNSGKIVEHILTKDLLNFTAPTDLTYNAKAKPATIEPKDGVTGVGEITVYYSGDDGANWTTTAPTAVGTYKVKADVAKGTFYKSATGFDFGSFTISYLATPTNPYSLSGGSLSSGTYLANKDITVVPASGYTLVNSDGTAFSNKITTNTEANTIKFNLKDSADHITDKISVAESTNIDKNAPTASIKVQTNTWSALQTEFNSNCYTTSIVNATITANDTNSGVAKIEYYITDSKFTNATNLETAANGKWLTYNENNKPSISSNKTNIFYAKVTDTAGNVSYISSQQIIHDDIKPVISNISGNPTNWTSSDATITCDVTDTNLKSVTYSKDGGTATTITSPYSFVATANGTYKITATDMAGNTSYQDVVIAKIDKTAPTIAVVGNTSTKMQSDTATITPTAGISGISKVEVKKNSGSYVDITSTYKSGYTVTANGTYTFKVTNGANVSETSPITYTNIDTTKPVVAVNSNGYTENTWCSSGNITLSISNTASNLGTTSFEYKVGDGNWTAYTAPIVISDDTKGTTYSFRGTSESGVVSDTKTFAVKRDVTAPSGDIKFNTSAVKKALNAISFGLFFKNTVSVDITGDDQTSGVSKIEYYKSSTVLTEANVKVITTWTVFDSLNITPADKDKFVIYVKVTDNAGNVTYFGSNGATFDTVSPVISGVTDGTTYYTSQKVTVTDDNIDLITVNGTAFTSGNNIAGNIDKTYVIKATDKAGNETTVTVTMKTIASIEDSINSITADNVKSADKTAIESVKTFANSIDTTNATDVEKTALNSIADNCDTLLTKIDNTANKIKSITDGVNAYSADTVKSSDKANLEEFISNIDELLNSQTITDEEKDNLLSLKSSASSLITKIEENKNAVNNDSVNNVSSINKDNVKISDKDALLEAKAALEDAINNHADNYTDEELESMKLQLASINESLDKIDELEKEQEKSEEGTSSKKDNSKESPKTGAGLSILLCAFALFVSGFGIAGAVGKKRKKEIE